MAQHMSVLGIDIVKQVFHGFCRNFPLKSFEV